MAQLGSSNFRGSNQGVGPASAASLEGTADFQAHVVVGGIRSLLAVSWRLPTAPCHVGLSKMAIHSGGFIQASKGGSLPARQKPHSCGTSS